MNVENCLKEVFSDKNVSYFKNYLKKLSIEEKMMNSLFFIYLIESLLFDFTIDTHFNIKESHFYQAINFSQTKYA